MQLKNYPIVNELFRVLLDKSKDNELASFELTTDKKGDRTRQAKFTDHKQEDQKTLVKYFQKNLKTQTESTT